MSHSFNSVQKPMAFVHGRLCHQLTVAVLCTLKCCAAISLHRHDGPVPRTTKAENSCIEFVQYKPSQWERTWLKEANSRSEQACDFLKEEVELGQEWVGGIANDADGTLKRFDDSVWSTYVYRNACSASRETFAIPIEPAVGLLRHPFAPPCTLDVPGRDVQDRDYMLLAPVALTSTFSGHKLLFDLGSGRDFDSSLRWFVDSYKNRGIEFDEIWAWEVQDTGPHEYWQTVPDEVVGKLHFYNTYASDRSGLPSPLGILKSKFVPGDFIVVKLDIDNEDLESRIMQQVLNMPEMIAEMFFEKHFDAPEMHPYFGQGLTSTLKDALTLFQKFRRAGLRLHYWP